MVEHYATFIVDESGSMSSIRADTIGAFNEQLRTLRQAPENPKVSLRTFASEVHDPVLWQEPLDRIEPLTEEDYRPGGKTAMIDAVCSTLDRLDGETFRERDDHLVIVLSDGKENNSTRYDAEYLRKRVKTMKEAGWTFLYLGDNQDLTEVEERTGMDTRKYDSTAAGTRQASEDLSKSTQAYYEKRKRIESEDKEDADSEDLDDPFGLTD